MINRTIPSIKNLFLTALFIASTTSSIAQDASIMQISSEARQVDRSPEGDRSYYGLWAKDHLLSSERYKKRFSSPEDSIQKRREFVKLCGIAFEAFEQKDALKTVIYGDSALQTGFDNAEIFLYMGISYEILGDYKHAKKSFQRAKAHNIANGGKILTAFNKRMKERKKEEKSRR